MTKRLLPIVASTIIGMGIAASSAHALDIDLPPLDSPPGTPVFACTSASSVQCTISGKVTRYDGLGAHYTPCAQVDVTGPSGVVTYDVTIYQRDDDGDDHGSGKLNTLPQWAYYTSVEATLLAAFTSGKPVLALIAAHNPQCDYPDDITQAPVKHLTLQRAQVIN